MKLSLMSGLLLILIAGNFAFAQNEPKKGGTIIWGRGADSVSLDPARPIDNESIKVTANIFEGLVRYKDGSTEVEPALAESWETSADEKQWIFHLRKGVFFHDNTPFNADSVVFSFLRQIDPHHPFYRKDFGYADFTFKYVKTVESVDEYTVKIVLESAYAPFLQNLAMFFASPIISPEAMKKWGDEFEKHPVGTGPFIFSQWIPNDRIILEKNTKYWAEPPLPDKLVFKSIPNNNSRLLAFKTAAIDCMDGISPKAAHEIEADRSLNLISWAGLNISYLAMNTQKKPFDNIKVRRAVNHAVNKQNLVKFFYKGSAIPAKSPVPPLLWGYNENIKDYEYNPDKARQLLKEAGFENGFKTTLWAMPVPRPYMPQPKEIARAIKGNLASVGIMAEIVSDMDWGTYLAKLMNGEHDMGMLGWVTDNGDPDNFLYVLLDKDNAVPPKATNIALFCNENIHEILKKAQQVSKKEERIRLYQSAQEIVHEQAPWFTIANIRQFIAHRKNIHGLAQHPTGIIRLNRAWVE
ncbi:Extracellular solute-binding protein, family 5 [Desulfonema limicola]|uniref:Extracellular solute-binding protein, family 5 n=1 Tax=Desulfonema limicola TaxID=45656 RepID=A0A975BA54_9BACT|nr:ABC transporter substrate-binding protein [Desulfonema limicola]QTA81561.1 Extracellular solute-binding protein, family 5 [Desulfonema limicola]